MEIKGINHLLYSVSHLDTSIEFYQNVFGAKLLVKGRTTAYFDLNGIWLALMKNLTFREMTLRRLIPIIAFTIEEWEFEEMSTKLKRFHANILPAENEMNAIENRFILPTLTATNLNFIPEPFKIGFVIINRKKRIWHFMIKTNSKYHTEHIHKSHVW
ncbi:fosfomycin resistance protein FosB [Bacillus inaquosorum KCTC 13429]|uniref:Fosfomycin resistance protein FosB n=1 Tax=Bacillus inaquosorum KCTC 13429 TaxID=1236548 RepID=A0A9W5PD28_9BACI|nr:fosfomycin resistance protein FosB [Bacillus inaquosorum KCTC 13429]